MTTAAFKYPLISKAAFDDSVSDNVKLMLENEDLEKRIRFKDAENRLLKASSQPQKVVYPVVNPDSQTLTEALMIDEDFVKKIEKFFSEKESTLKFGDEKLYKFEWLEEGVKELSTNFNESFFIAVVFGGYTAQKRIMMEAYVRQQQYLDQLNKLRTKLEGNEEGNEDESGLEPA